METLATKCQVCNKAIIDPRKYKRHLDRHQENGDNLELVGKLKMELELERIHRVKKYQCEACKKYYTTPYTLKLHQNEHCSGHDYSNSVILRKAEKILKKSINLDQLSHFRLTIDKRTKELIEDNEPSCVIPVFNKYNKWYHTYRVTKLVSE